MKSFNSRVFATLFFTALSCCAQAQTSDNATADNAPDNQEPGWLHRTYNSAADTVENLYDNGRLSMVLSGEAHHGRGTYTQEKIDSFTEKVWGLGMSKELRDDKGNEEDISFVVMADSHYAPQITAGYGYQWMMGLGNNWEVGAGYTAGLISRADIFGGVPFPGILPLVTIGTRDTKLLISYIPKLSGTGDGDVLYLALRVALK
jgi:palmitoyl transferase